MRTPYSTQQRGPAVSAQRLLIHVARRVPLLGSIARRFARSMSGTHHLAAIAVIPDGAGQVLIAEHSLRNRRWGLPGGWIKRHEHPEAAVRREVGEELGIEVIVERVVATESHTGTPGSRSRSAVTIAFLCGLTDDASLVGRPNFRLSPEILSVRWVDAADVHQWLTPFECAAVARALADSALTGR